MENIKAIFQKTKRKTKPACSSPGSGARFWEEFVKASLLVLILLTAYNYAQGTSGGLAGAQRIVMGLDEKPYVYRALVPWLAHLLVLLGVPADTALTVLVMLSAIGLVYGIKYLLNSFRKHGLFEFLISSLGVEVFMSVFSLNSKVYDLSTAMFFAFSFGLLARGKLKAFYLLYPLACLNRESMLLLSLFFAVHFLTRLKLVQYGFSLAYQGSAWLVTRWILMKIFEG